MQDRYQAKLDLIWGQQSPCTCQGGSGQVIQPLLSLSLLIGKIRLIAQPCKVVLRISIKCCILIDLSVRQVADAKKKWRL